MSKKWKTGSNITDYYHNEAGKVLGKVSRGSFSDETYYAEANGNSLGEYIDKASAKAAVEKSINNPFFDLDDVISKNTFEHYSSIDTGYSGTSDPYLTPMFEAQDIDYPVDFDYNLKDSIVNWSVTNSWPEVDIKIEKKKKK